MANFASGTVWTGDNLAVMRGMNSECVDLIYLDPPFNSNRTYEAPIGSKAAGAAFKDAWTLNDVDVHEHGELADRNPAAYSVIEAARQAHGKGMQSYLIMMSVRLLEMRRVLKPTGSIYLHCDDAAGHWLKALMDAVFGAAAFRNEVVWKRTSGHSDAKGCGRVHDVIFYYAMGDNATWNDIFQEYDPKYVESYYRYRDENGRQFMSSDLSGAGDGPSRTFGNHGVIPPPSGRHWMFDQSGIDRAISENRIYWTKNGVPRLKKYLDEAQGVPVQDVWTDIQALRSWHDERVGYPTQKPVALLERIIRASSNPRDMVLDPFCGCATALVAADRLQRQWAGIDLSPLAIKLVNERVAEDRGLWGSATALTEPPRRTDLGDLPNYRTHRHRIYGEQEGVCAGCETHFPFRVMDVDHMLPRSKGGTDHPDNLQLLCSGCNRSKGGRTMAEWRAAQ